MDLTKCSMCYLELPKDEVISHVIRSHKFDPNFIVYCNQPGCGASYKNWASYRKHIQRVHRLTIENTIEDDTNGENIADVPMDVHEPYDDENNELSELGELLTKLSFTFCFILTKCKKLYSINYIFLIILYNNVDFYSDNELPISRQDLLRWHASMFVTNLKESCSIPQSTIENVIQGTQQLIEEIMSIVKVSVRIKRE